MGIDKSNGRGRKHPYLKMEESDFAFLKPEKQGFPLTIGTNEWAEFCKTRQGLK